MSAQMATCMALRRLALTAVGHPRLCELSRWLCYDLLDMIAQLEPLESISLERCHSRYIVQCDIRGAWAWRHFQDTTADAPEAPRQPTNMFSEDGEHDRLSDAIVYHVLSLVLATAEFYCYDYTRPLIFASVNYDRLIRRPLMAHMIPALAARLSLVCRRCATTQHWVYHPAHKHSCLQIPPRSLRGARRR